MRSKASPIALGGLLTAAAVVVMCMGSMIPINTYICPVVCILLTRPLLSQYGKRIAGCYYAAVSILSLLLAPDREAAIVYVFLGYYPLIKPWFDRIRPVGLRMCLKILLFTAAGGLSYFLMIAILGMDALAAEFQGIGIAMTTVMIGMWLVLFMLVDRLLGMPLRRKK